MPTRPTWSGSIQISVVSIAVKIFPATNPGRQVEFHQIDRKTHKRVHHQNVDEAGEVEKAKTKVVDIIDALRSSLAQGKKPKRAVKKTTRRKEAA